MGNATVWCEACDDYGNSTPADILIQIACAHCGSFFRSQLCEAHFDDPGPILRAKHDCPRKPRKE